MRNNLVVYYSIDKWGHCFINVQEANGNVICLAVDRSYKSDSGIIPENLYAHHYSKSRKGFSVNLPLSEVFVLCEKIRKGLLNGSIKINREPDLEEISDTYLTVYTQELNPNLIKDYKQNKMEYMIENYNILREAALKEIERRKKL